MSVNPLIEALPVSKFRVSIFLQKCLQINNYQSSSTHFLQISSLTLYTILNCKIYRNHSQRVAMMGSLEVLLEQEFSVYCNGTDPKGRVLALKIDQLSVDLPSFQVSNITFDWQAQQAVLLLVKQRISWLQNLTVRVIRKAST